MEWYEELDYEENPFKDSEETELIGYEGVIEEVLYRLDSGNIVCLEGKSGAGKTAVLNSILNKFGGNGYGKVVYLNGQQLNNGLNIEKLLNKKAGILKRMFHKKPKDMILLLDEVQDISKKNCERIKYYFDNNFVRSVVFTSSNFKKANFTDSLKERISKTVKLRDLTEDEAVDIIHSRLGNDELIPEEVIKEVFNRSERNMKSFLKNCEKLCTFSFENNGKKVLPEHVSEVFGRAEEPKKFELETEEPEKAVNKKVIINTTKKDSNVKNEAKSAKKETSSEDPKMAVEEPVTVTIIDDFKPEKKEVKMELKEQEEEIDIDSELKKLKKKKTEDDDDLDMGDYKEDYEDTEEPEDDEKTKGNRENYEDGDIAEKYY